MHLKAAIYVWSFVPHCIVIFSYNMVLHVHKHDSDSSDEFCCFAVCVSC